jgi:hypothetical protein
VAVVEDTPASQIYPPASSKNSSHNNNYQEEPTQDTSGNTSGENTDSDTGTGDIAEPPSTDQPPATDIDQSGGDQGASQLDMSLPSNQFTVPLSEQVSMPPGGQAATAPTSIPASGTPPVTG